LHPPPTPRAYLGITVHFLRHTAASLAIAEGANVKVVQSMLGHQSATLTLDLYGHLLPDQRDEVAAAMDTAFASAQQQETDETRTARIVRTPLA
jgi:integrase